MGHCIFIHRQDSIYDDAPAEKYQFPRQYLKRAQSAEGDWIIYLEPSKVPRSRGYFALARVARIIPDPTEQSMYLAVIEPGSYLEFAEPVPFREDEGPVERGLLNDSGVLSGRAQSAVRPLSSDDFFRIVERGLGRTNTVLPRTEVKQLTGGLSDHQSPYLFETERHRIETLVQPTVAGQGLSSAHIAGI